jgi:hypothetical protein
MADGAAHIGPTLIPAPESPNPRRVVLTTEMPAGTLRHVHADLTGHSISAR